MTEKEFIKKYGKEPTPRELEQAQVKVIQPFYALTDKESKTIRERIKGYAPFTHS